VSDEGEAPPGLPPDPRLPRPGPEQPEGAPGASPEEGADEPWQPRSLPAPPPPGSKIAGGEQPAPAARPPRVPPPNYLPPPPPRARPAMAPLEPLESPPARSGPPPWVWVVSVVAAAVIVAVFVVLVLRSQSASPLVVGTDLTLDSTSQTSGDCVTTVHFTAHGSLSGSGTLTYRFERSDGQSTGDQQLSADGNTGFAITEDWRFVGVHSGGGTMIFRVVSPATRELRRDVTVRCP
jgi:hypothetical protein